LGVELIFGKWMAGGPAWWNFHTANPWKYHLLLPGPKGRDLIGDPSRARTATTTVTIPSRETIIQNGTGTGARGPIGSTTDAFWSETGAFLARPLSRQQVLMVLFRGRGSYPLQEQIFPPYPGTFLKIQLRVRLFKLFQSTSVNFRVGNRPPSNVTGRSATLLATFQTGRREIGPGEAI